MVRTPARQLALAVALSVTLSVVIMLSWTRLTEVFAGPAALAQTSAPSIVAYQGRVSVAGVPHNGSGFFKFALVDSTGTTSFWSNDGSSAGGAEPTAAVSLSVADGLFTVLLGDTAISGMTQPLAPSVFSGADRRLRVWFAASANGPFTQLTPDQRVAAAPYALVADTLDGLDSTALQQRVSGTCASGQAIQSIDAAGAVACETDDNTTYTAGAGLALNGNQFLAQGSPYANVVIVAKSGGDFSTVTDALNSITDASSDNGYLVFVAPGVYTETVTMKPYVDIEGAGEHATMISQVGSSTVSTGTVVGADHAALRTLTVRNTGGNSFAIGIYCGTTAPSIVQVAVQVSGGTTLSIGLYNNNGASTLVRNVSISVDTNTTGFGIDNDFSSPDLANITVIVNATVHAEGIRNYVSSGNIFSSGVISVTSAGSANGIANNFGAPRISHVTVNVSGTTSSGIQVSGGTPEVEDANIRSEGTTAYGLNTSNAAASTFIHVTATVSGTATSVGGTSFSSSDVYRYSTLKVDGAGTRYGLQQSASGGSFTETVDHSYIEGATATIQKDNEYITHVALSVLAGGGIGGTGTISCAGVTNETNTFFAGSCP